MKFSIVIVCFLFSSYSYGAFSSFSLASIFRGKAFLVKTIESKNCFISYVLINGKKYIVKQKKSEKKQMSVVRDAYCAEIAKELNIAHKGDIVSCTKLFPGKVFPQRPAIILTIASGDTVRSQRECLYSTLRLRQLWAKAPSFSDKGLTRAMIKQITWHWQLPIMFALDLFTGNSDRHCGNFCYDPKTDRFCAIDMDDTLNKDLCDLACKKLLFILKTDTEPFSKQELMALNEVKKTLQYFVTKFQSLVLVKKLHYFARKAGFIPGTSLYEETSAQKKLLLYESMIIKSYESAHKLIALLSDIVVKKSVVIKGE